MTPKASYDKQKDRSRNGCSIYSKTVINDLALGDPHDSCPQIHQSVEVVQTAKKNLIHENFISVEPFNSNLDFTPGSSSLQKESRNETFHYHDTLVKVKEV